MEKFVINGTTLSLFLVVCLQVVSSVGNHAVEDCFQIHKTVTKEQTVRSLRILPPEYS